MAKNDKIGNDEKKTKSMLNNTLFHVKKCKKNVKKNSVVSHQFHSILNVAKSHLKKNLILIIMRQKI